MHTTGTTQRYRNNFSGARDWKSDQKSSTVFHSFFWCPTNEFIAISAPNIFDISSKALVGKMLLCMCHVCSGSVRMWECEGVGSLQPQATWQAFHTTKCLDSLHYSFCCLQYESTEKPADLLPVNQNQTKNAF